MNKWLLTALLSFALVHELPAADPPAATGGLGICQLPDNRIVGPRTRNRPLPLLAGDAAHGFHPACTVSWSSVSPNNESLPVVGCFQDSLLQLANDSACGRGTGRLWVSSRWVLTSADLQRAQSRVAATCQRLDNSAVAATRDFLPECVPHNGELPPKGDARPGVAAGAAAPAAAATPGPPPAAAPAPH
jgi:hypothetical protein